MPDWSYHTLFKPVLSRLPSRAARSFTLGAMGRISRIPGGTFLIKTLGHMEPSPLLRDRISGLPIQTPLGLSGSADPSGIAHRALSQFGFGFIEVGPVTVRPIVSNAPIRSDRASGTIVYPDEYENPGFVRALRMLEEAKDGLPRWVRIAPEPEASPDQAVAQLRLLADAFSLANASGLYVEALSADRSTEDNLAQLEQIDACIRGLTAERAPLFFLYVPLDFPNSQLKPMLSALDRRLWSGCAIGGAWRTSDGAVRVGAGGKEAALEKIKIIREELPVGSWTIHTAAGIHEPQDAVDALRAGADHLLLNSGLVHSGPGLPKRINEAIIHERIADQPTPAPPSFWKHWGWMCLLGLGMIVGGIVAWLIAESSVLLPYDEQYLGMTRDEIGRINEHLLHFMSHDRITLAGTMISIGILYYRLGQYGMRYGQHWARTAVLTSGAVGFPSFFLYLGYGFFDPLHAAAAALLLPMFLLSMRRNPDQPFREPVNLRNSREWRLGLWGQLLFVALGLSLSIGGLVIAGVGVTTVFVPQDLAFLGVAAAELDAANPRLIPLIAHDRAGFGGALFSNAVMLLVLSLWGIRQGERWLWWTLLAGGTPAFVAGLSVHYSIGYVDFVHLLPAYFAAALFAAGLILLYPYLMRDVRAPSETAERRMTVT
ncbi:hypothetical protein [Cohnella hongkongensis]|uniref:Dihydroorotate dehydrogenase domain-containing protein n=1 Tax=Cohnella hongkongensis TaxID=178337 RepID=A0ABV9FBE8_9BACL